MVIPGDIVRKTTGHRDTSAPDEEQDDANLFKIGGVDGTRTRDLRRDRRKE
jgi:hypothetical protein